VGVGRKDVVAEHDIGFVEVSRRLEVGAVDVDGLHHQLWSEVRRKGVGQAKIRGQLSTKQAGAQDPELRCQAFARYGGDRQTRIFGKIFHEFHDIARERIWVRVEVAAQGARCDLIGARSPAQAQVDAPGVERLKRAELFGNDQRRMVRQHDAAGAHTYGGGAARNVTNEYRRGSAGNAWHAVVLGPPVAMKAERLGVAGQLQAVAEGSGGVAEIGRAHV